ncbi:uncharacterized protein LOC142486593 isoform X6 [Ascaphus truei]|uniref:uncharacterized protein LOC142486593 isoform X6 n=1 Tax=Ascaphus truei TaxID=8439 RepID=UPI003F591690
MSSSKPIRDTQRSQDMEVSVGIFSWDTDIIWVLHLLQEDPFKEMISQIMKGTLCVPTTEETWNCEAGKCTFILLYHSMRSGRSVSDMGDYLKHFLSTHGWRNVLVVIGAQEYTMSEKMREQLGQNQFVSCEQLFFTETEITILRREIRRMVEQVIRIRYILSLTQDPPIRRVGPMSLLKQKHSIGIISRSMQEYYEWLECLLRSKDFTDQVKDVRHFHISNMGDEKIREEISRCTFAILYITKVYKGINNDLQCLSTFGKENVIVVFDNLEDSSSEEKRRILQKEPSIGRLAREIFLFSMAEKESEYMKHLSCFDQVDKMMQEKLNKMEIMIYQSGTQGNRISRFGKTEAKYTIGIFSRSGHSEYKWLVHLLRSEDFRDQVQDVRPCYISNAGGRQFREDVSQCTFAILYHTKNRGRINITDVTDSMYDKKLHYLSAVLGKENVIVVVDDLEDSSSEEKRRILETQPSIGRLAQGLILFTQRVKEDDKMLLGKLKSMWLVLRGKENVIVMIDDLEDSSSEEKRRILQNQPKIERLAKELILLSQGEKKENKRLLRKLKSIWHPISDSKTQQAGAGDAGNQNNDNTKDLPKRPAEPGGDRGGLPQNLPLVPADPQARAHRDVPAPQETQQAGAGDAGNQNNDNTKDLPKRPAEPGGDRGGLPQNLPLVPADPQARAHRDVPAPQETQQAGAGDAGNQNNDNTKDLPKRPAEPGGDRGGLPQNLPLVPADPQARAHRDVPAPQETQQAGAGDAGNQNNDNTKDLPKRPAEPGGDRGGLPQNLPLVPADPQARAHRDVPAPQETQQAGAGDAGNQNNDNTKDLPKRPAEPGGDRGGLPQNLPLVPADPQARAHRDVPAPQGKELDVKNQAEKNMVTPGRLLLTAGRPGMLSLEEVVQRVGDNMDIQFGSKEDHYETPLLFQERGSYKEKTMTTCALVPVSLCDRSMDTEKGWIEYIFATCVLLGVGIGIDYLKPDALFSAIFSVGILLAVGALVLYLIQEDEKVESSMSISAEHFVYKHRATLIERLASLDPILDELLEKRLIHYEQYEKVRCERTSQDKMRMLYRFVRAWGICDLDIFYQILKAKNNPLIKDLEGL